MSLEYTLLLILLSVGSIIITFSIKEGVRNEHQKKREILLNFQERQNKRLKYLQDKMETTYQKINERNN